MVHTYPVVFLHGKEKLWRVRPKKTKTFSPCKHQPNILLHFNQEYYNPRQFHSKKKEKEREGAKMY